MALNKYLQNIAPQNGACADDPQQSETTTAQPLDMALPSLNDAGTEHGIPLEAVDPHDSQQNRTASAQIEDVVSGNLTEWGEIIPGHDDAVDARDDIPGAFDRTDVQHETRALALAGDFISSNSLPPDWGEMIPGPSVHSQHPLDRQYSTLDFSDTSATMHWRIPDAVPEPGPDGTKTISDAAVFAQQVYIAASKIISRKSANDLSSPSSISPSEHFVNEIASTAVEVIGSLAGLNTYIYGIVGCHSSSH